MTVHLFVLSCFIFKLIRVTPRKQQKAVLSAQGLLKEPFQRSCYLDMHTKHEIATQKKRPKRCSAQSRAGMALRYLRAPGVRR